MEPNLSLTSSRDLVDLRVLKCMLLMTASIDLTMKFISSLNSISPACKSVNIGGTMGSMAALIASPKGSILLSALLMISSVLLAISSAAIT